MNSLSLIRKLIITLFILHRNINLSSHYMVPLHKEQKHKDPMVEHHVTCLPLHLFSVQLNLPSFPAIHHASARAHNAKLLFHC